MGEYTKEPWERALDIMQAKDAEIARLRACLAEAEQEATNLATTLHKRYYAEITQWSPLAGDVVGITTQIDNMVFGIVHDKEAEIARLRAEVEKLREYVEQAATDFTTLSKARDGDFDTIGLNSFGNICLCQARDALAATEKE
jgi:hypothetical protein